MLTIQSGSSKAVINPHGAWVEELNEGNKPILFPKTQLLSDSGDQKARGGMHVCLPNFGPGGDSELDQHGFGRTMNWSVPRSSKSSVTLELKSPNLRYEGLISKITYDIKDKSLTATLNIKNNGPTTIRVAPGFHPYFYLEESDSAIFVNDTMYDLSDLGAAKYLESENITIKTSNSRLLVSQSQLNHWAIWTDRLANYVCVEPTFGGNRFLEDPAPEELLLEGQEKSYSCTISW